VLNEAKDSSPSPWYCHELECPKFTIEDSYNGTELRSYEASVWASTNVNETSYDSAVRTGFKRLFDYIQGANQNKQKIEMTAPVKVQVTPGSGPTCENHFIVSFFVPFGLQSDPPKPTSADVYIERVPASRYYVTSYGGWSSQQVMLNKADELLKQLGRLGKRYDTSVFYTAGYDSPYRLEDRHNEVWVPAL
jgi:hypothetical protein